jgi:hypothetical protein
MAAGDRRPQRPLREEIRWWLHHDARTYAQRLAPVVAEAADPRGAGTARRLATQGVGESGR